MQELERSFYKDVKKVRQYPGNQERIAQLAAASEALDQADRSAVAGLKATGQPDIWYDVYRYLEKTHKRHEELKTLPAEALAQMNVSDAGLEEEMAEAKNRAMAYFYAHAGKLLQEESPAAAREAYGELLLLAGLDGHYKETDVLLRKAVMTGASDIQYELVNRTGYALNTRITDELSVAVQTYRAARAGKGAAGPSSGEFPFIIRIYLTELEVSPERIKHTSYGEERDVYENGRVSDTIRCTIEQYRQVKGAVVRGRIDIYDMSAQNVINTVPLYAESIFEHSYGTLKGDPAAAGEETRAMLIQTKKAFPSNEEMVMDAVKEFTRQAVKVLVP